MHVRLAIPIAAAAAAAGLLAGCSTQQDPHEAATPATSRPATPTPAGTDPGTVTATVTTGPSAATTVTATAPPGTATAAPSDVLNAYFDAVNARDYARAWALGGPAFASDYASFVRDHATTVNYDLTILSVNGGVVDAVMDVTHTDGTHHYYRGTYTVLDGVIVGTSMQETSPGSSGGSSGPGASATLTTPGQAPLHFHNCAEAWDAHAAPMTRGAPGYDERLDRDHDGVACEPSPSGDAP